MIPFVFILFTLLLTSIDTAILKCDFETDCSDFDIDTNWGLTDGAHPQPINHDHTLNTSAGHYLFYTPQSSPPFHQVDAKIKTKQWVQLPTDRAVCFQMWYYTPHANLPFSIQLVQGDDDQLTRIVATIPGKVPSINDWTLVNIALPAEKFKLLIQLNISTTPLAFDDLSIDYCDKPLPPPPTTLYTCNFESSCTTDFVPLPNYPYEWSIMKASDAVKVDSLAPTTDFTYGNESGHYAFVPSSKTYRKGYVGYLALRTSMNITANESFCLNFQYYGYGRTYAGSLLIYAQFSESSETIQQVWPPQNRRYSYRSDQRTWGIAQLPIGDYSLLFRVDSSDNYRSSYAIDDVSVTSCDYPPTTFYEDGAALLSFSCDFDNLTMCGMLSEDRFMKSTYNFTAMTGETIPDRSLGPFYDHTTNSSTGGFSYWDRRLPFTSSDMGYLFPAYSMASNLGMCIRFAYYVKSSVDNKNSTQLAVTTGGCLGAMLWSTSLDDSRGWQVVVIPAPDVACMESYYFSVYQRGTVRVAVAVDDFIIDQCSMFTTTTTTTSTTTTTTTTTTVTSTTTTTSTTVSHTTQSTTTTTTAPVSSSTTSTSSTTATTPPKSRAGKLLSSNTLQIILVYLLFHIVQYLS
ncbi:unnamed protein product [Adineta ricciae]|uniref:MAM domain-containing protein n=1 Tax=Adineta ricciae TaxID=249248 RepID=A0A813NLR7_ADIRI|nr:unnamed protein product [Adineta ricciae]CAF0792967.1 unnamed protein product [Adineta ricciae]